MTNRIGFYGVLGTAEIKGAADAYSVYCENDSRFGFSKEEWLQAVADTYHIPAIMIEREARRLEQEYLAESL